MLALLRLLRLLEGGDKAAYDGTHSVRETQPALPGLLCGTVFEAACRSQHTLSCTAVFTRSALVSHSHSRRDLVLCRVVMWSVEQEGKVEALDRLQEAFARMGERKTALKYGRMLWKATVLLNDKKQQKLARAGAAGAAGAAEPQAIVFYNDGRAAQGTQA